MRVVMLVKIVLMPKEIAKGNKLESRNDKLRSFHLDNLFCDTKDVFSIEKKLNSFSGKRGVIFLM